jgi:hypothetical protein
VERHDERFKVGLPQELDLVDEEDDADSLILGGFADRDEQIGQILRQRTAVSDAGECVDVEAGGHRTIRIERDGERLEDGCSPQHAIRSPGFGSDLQESSAHLRRDLEGKGGVLLDFPLDGGPVASLGLLTEHVEQHRLAGARNIGIPA